MGKTKKNFVVSKFRILCFTSLVLALPFNSISLATNITGVSGFNGVYYIKPQKVSGNTGFRQYSNFSLDKGNTASLMFVNGITRYINAVDNQVTINGILNTVDANKNFYNGKAIFVSPKGFVVGESGIVNVGALEVYTPSSSVYNEFKKKSVNRMSDIELSNDKYFGNGNIKINGMVLARENITLKGNNIYINEGAKIATGFKNKDENNLVSQKGIAKYSQQKTKTNAPIKAEELFNILVNTGKYGFNVSNNDIDISSSNGDLILTTNRGTIIENSTIVANGDISVLNKDRYNVKIAGEQYVNGDYFVSQSARSLAGNLYIDGDVNTNGKIEFEQNSNGNTYISGKVKSKNDMLINQNPYGKYTESANKGNIYVGGDLKSTEGDIKITNNGIENIIVENNVAVETSGDKSFIIEHGNKGDILIKENGNVDVSNNVKIIHNGEGNINIDGKIKATELIGVEHNYSGSTISNSQNGSNGDIKLSGIFESTNSILDVEHNGIGNIIIDDEMKIITRPHINSLIRHENNGNIIVQEDGVINSNYNIQLVNDGYGDIDIQGTIISDNGNIYLTKNENSVGKIDVSGNIKNNGTWVVSDDGYLRVITGVINIHHDGIADSNGDLINVKDTGVLETQNLIVIKRANKEQGDINLDGTLSSDCEMNIYTPSDLNIEGDLESRRIYFTISDSGNINLDRGSISLKDDSDLWGGPSTISLNSDAGDITIDGLVYGNSGGNISIMSETGAITIKEHGYVNNINSKIELISYGDKDIKVLGIPSQNLYGQVAADNGYLYIKPLGEGQFKLEGGVAGASNVAHTEESRVIIQEN